MPKLSRYRPELPILQHIQIQLFNAFSLLKDENQVQEFLEILLTRTEIKMLAKRLGIAKMYLDKENYGNIRKTLKVGDNTIARISSKLVDNPIIVKIIDQLNKIEAAQLKASQQKIPNPMDPYFRTTNAVDQALDYAISTTTKKIKAHIRHQRIKSNLSKPTS